MTYEAGVRQGVETRPADLYAELFGKQASTLEVVSTGRLSQVGARPPIRTYLAQLWRRRHFLWAEARAKVTSGTRETLLGQAWLVINPMLNGLAYYLIFGQVLGAKGGIENFLGYLIVGVFLFQFTTQCVTGGAKSIAGGRNLIRAFSFPRASLPISVVLRGMLNLAPTLGAMFVLLLVLPDQEHWTTAAALFPAVLALQVVFVTGLSLLLARAAAALPDLNQLISVLMRFWLYGSAVFFSIERFENYPWIVGIMEINPMYLVLDAARDTLLYGVVPAVSTWVGLGAWAVGTVVVGFLVFWRAEESYGRA
ncbi:ABC transporter permease [Krasilnikoviella flava]|uniref:Transport permease protein n=1 Tax=Krasilnikoviella flava TaxID=526729 RepID=A0A1T5IIM4_9MICO|nr:ABC transporter permease [Krasilnikoviella flava]SKC38888.1 teichoic acid transport system permease protein [Krasilnikoviella flava]